ncbi:uncharacterized protein MELLADRAFT_69748 [Melampsora larici-populina 98AG31]|uniref:J domain-containing protein n=1 Tax=Melampsora larici-populina (strain 98AG31 / pathotype 3-4-7) TaxID=747676 RepID=F4SC11_MELLP|nr:uncharacterized protein MELLADRAFT_69748 [Melampsora larici-populina 98AG31]EGF97798.1 hypothetical protein MELLADRAFT_69748 [Melampsora larici-populina 98AG31]
MRESCYDILGVKRHDNQDAILHSFLVHRLMLNREGSSQDRAHYRRVKNAFEILHDPAKRRLHDAFLDSNAHSPRPSSSSPAPAAPRLQYQALRAGSSTQVRTTNNRTLVDFTPTLEPHKSGAKERRLYLYGDSEKGSNPPFATNESTIPFPTKIPWPTIKRKEAKDNMAAYVDPPKPQALPESENGKEKQIEAKRRPSKLQKKRPS